MGSASNVFDRKHDLAMQKKKIFLTVGFTIFFSLLLFLMYNIIEKVAAKKEVQAKIQTLPIGVPLFTLDSTYYQLQRNRTVVLIYFNSECQHCQYELGEIQKNVPAFADTEIVFMSSENLSVIREIPPQYTLTQPNFHFTKINPEDVFENFGSLSVPNIFIYGADGKLIKEFKGETKMEAILKYAKP